MSSLVNSVIDDWIIVDFNNYSGRLVGWICAPLVIKVYQRRLVN